ncbi:MAG: YdiU family protein [Planctomycetes bacterium]|nr:YdiU family protein [Planctomycetota bacterium]
MPSLPRFDHRCLDALPGDPRTDTASRQVHGALWSRVQPTPVAAPRLLAFSRPLARELGLDAALFADPATAEVLAGNRLWPGMDPYAANYGGHQFGHWAGQLGDGRAIVLGELRRPDGTLVELQLKGAGPTAYSRAGDGRAVLRSSIREFLCSEAMHWLGVPTTRALSLCATGDAVVRDMFYDGNPQAEPGAVVCRVAASFLRFGNFELPASRGDVALLRQLTDFTLTQFFADLGPPGKTGYAALLQEVARRTARLIAHWQAIGFVHGVMNTDNLSMLGLTIDYGPYGWIDDFDLGWTPNTTDAQMRRYAFGNQPGIGRWNVERLGEALLPLFDGDEAPVHAAVEQYRATYAEAATQRFAAKLGLTFDAARGDGALLQQCLDWLAAQETDMTLFFRALSRVVVLDAPPATLPAAVRAAFYRAVPEAHVAAGIAWLRRWWQRARQEARGPAELARAMDAANPKFVLRNWLAQEAIDAAHGGDLGKVQRLLEVLERPFDDQPQHDDLAQKRPDWARDKPGCSALSCSS